MAMKMIRVGDEIPDTSFAIKNGASVEIKNTHQEFIRKNILLLGIPGPFVSDYPSSMLKGYEYHYEKFKKYQIDEVYCTTTMDTYIMRKWFQDEGIKNIKALPDGNVTWCRSIGMNVDMERSFMGERSHRYVMILSNLQLKKIFYEDLSHDPHTCFLETNAEKVLTYLDDIQETWEKF